MEALISVKCSVDSPLESYLDKRMQQTITSTPRVFYL